MPNGCVLFFDEIDSLCRKRSDGEDETSRRVKNEFLKQLDACSTGGRGKSKIVLIAATNRPWELDSAVLRRFQRQVHVPLPNHAERGMMWRDMLAAEAMQLTSEEEELLAQRSAGLSGSDIKGAIQEGLLAPIRELSAATHFRLREGGGPTPSYQPCSENTDGALPRGSRDGHTLYPRDATVGDLVRALEHAQRSVSSEEAERCAVWAAQRQAMKRAEEELEREEREGERDLGAEEEATHNDKKPRSDCPYLDTINRSVLDFDFEKLCSVSLSNLNVYACLVCGKYFQGRGKTSHAYFHALNSDHHVFINLQTHQVYALPEGYEVLHASLDDIKFVLSPVYPRADVAKLDKNTVASRCLDGSEYLPGVVGLNNIKNNDALNAVIQALAHVAPLRDHFLLRTTGTPLCAGFSEVLRKLWNPRNFRAHVSPHEFLQVIAAASEKRFKIGVRSDPVDFLAWLLNTLHQHSPRPPIVHQTFQGEVRVTTKTIRSGAAGEESSAAETITQPFLHLALDLPVSPLYKDANEVNAIPHVPLQTLLAKFDGRTWTDLPGSVLQRKQYVITRLPRYLVLHMRRFRRNNFFKEKNPTIVNFPLQGLDMKDYTDGPQPATKYNLVASLRHEGEMEKGQWSVYVQNRGNGKWFEVNDITVTEVMPQLIMVSEAYLQIYERQDE